MNFFTSWDILGISLVLSLRFLGPFALGISLIVWAAFAPSSRSGTRRRSSLLILALGVLMCVAPVVLFLATDILG
ncbi:MAG: hypothetical protein AVDCRST_MAG28-1410 [uncultured Rubrobacteraceae bacterium]|uniref:Uncharacterized protein n=1 Tax=uncultured Rubrobacteraceae bacterium TaxID=349277 RepID=A0A6J4QUL4_9ACTN|nr:MAG: hypothetical protein AVDCRST_MAG28-1410 [uncultured Rubrobacteraceae bacterium]